MLNRNLNTALEDELNAEDLAATLNRFMYCRLVANCPGTMTFLFRF